MRSLSFIIFVAACAANRPVPSGVVQPELGSSHARTSQAIAPGDPTAAGRTASVQATQLLAATKLLETGVEPERLSQALDALATAIDAIAPGATGDTQDVRNAADDLVRAQAPVASLRTGLDVAVRAMGEAKPPTEADQARYQLATDDMHAAISAIDPTRPIAEQQVIVRAAFRAATRAVLAAQDAPAPTFDAEASTALR